MQKNGWIIIAAFIFIIGIVWYKLAQREVAREGIGSMVDESSVEEALPQKASLFAADGTYCFEYSHAATTDAPYSVQEKLTLTKVGQSITGEKRGTQAGPDMTNGYDGVIVGTLSDDGIHINDIFSYTIEGSKQSEAEVYEVSNDSLTKLRYELSDIRGVLTPDMNSSPIGLMYLQGDC